MNRLIILSVFNEGGVMYPVFNLVCVVLSLTIQLHGLRAADISDGVYLMKYAENPQQVDYLRVVTSGNKALVLYQYKCYGVGVSQKGYFDVKFDYESWSEFDLTVKKAEDENYLGNLRIVGGGVNGKEFEFTLEQQLSQNKLTDVISKSGKGRDLSIPGIRRSIECTLKALEKNVPEYSLLWGEDEENIGMYRDEHLDVLNKITKGLSEYKLYLYCMNGRIFIKVDLNSTIEGLHSVWIENQHGIWFFPKQYTVHPGHSLKKESDKSRQDLAVEVAKSLVKSALESDLELFLSIQPPEKLMKKLGYDWSKELARLTMGLKDLNIKQLSDVEFTYIDGTEFRNYQSLSNRYKDRFELIRAVNLDFGEGKVNPVAMGYNEIDGWRLIK